MGRMGWWQRLVRPRHGSDLRSREIAETPEPRQERLQYWLCPLLT